MGYSSNRTFLVFRAFRVTYKNYYQFQSRRQPVPNWIPHRVGTVSYFDKSTLRYKTFRYKIPSIQVLRYNPRYQFTLGPANENEPDHSDHPDGWWVKFKEIQFD